MRRRLVFAVVAIVALILFVHDVPLRTHLQRVEKDRVVTALERDASTLAAKAQQLLVAENPATASTAAGTTLAGLVEDYALRGTALVVIVDAEGSVEAATDSTVTIGSSYLNRPEIASALLGNSVVGERRSVTLGQDLVYSAVPVLTTDRVIGAVRLTYPKSVVDERVSGRLRGLALLALISLVLAFFASFVIATSVIRPLRNLRNKSDAIASGELSARAEVEGPIEIRELAKSFNGMAGRVEQMLAEQRGFAGDASHQLRTPLTALRLRVEQALATVSENPEALASAIIDDLDAAVNELERLSRLVEQLLALARTEAPTGHVRVDVAAVIAERIEMWSPLAEERGLELVSANHNPEVTVEAIPGALEQILDNYIDNALDYAPVGTAISLDVTRGGDDVTLSVADRGAGMSAESRERAFDRFWRGAESQNRPGGSGLGLSIVAQLAAASGGRVELRENPGGGLLATVTLRVAQLRRHDDNNSL
jgi:signal transduction histidine kinase